MKNKTSFSVIYILLICLVLPVFGQGNLSDSLVVWYNFDGNLQDNSGNGNHGTLDEGVIENYNSGLSVRGESLVMDGANTRVLTGEAPIFMNLGTTDFTICMWFFLPEHGDPGGLQRMLSQLDGTGTGNLMLAAKWIADSTAYDIIISWLGGDPRIDIDFEVPYNEWHNYAVTLTQGTDGGADTVKYFVDGEILLTQEIEMLEADGQVVFGGGKDTNLPTWLGLMDDAYIFKRVLTADEIKDVMDGQLVSSIDDNTTPGLVETYKLQQNFPNPFNPNTTISFNISKAGHTKLQVYNITGQLVKVMLNEELSAGNYSVNLNADSMPSGIYLYQLTSGTFNQIRKAVLVK